MSPELRAQAHNVSLKHCGDGCRHGALWDGAEDVGREEDPFSVFRATPGLAALLRA